MIQVLHLFKEEWIMIMIQVLHLFKEEWRGQAKYDNWIMVWGWGGINTMMDKSFAAGIHRKLQFTSNLV